MSNHTLVLKINTRTCDCQIGNNVSIINEGHPIQFLKPPEGAKLENTEFALLNSLKCRVVGAA